MANSEWRIEKKKRFPSPFWIRHFAFKERSRGEG
jgi:hypothetical protein